MQESWTPRRRTELLVLGVILLVATALRLGGVFSDYPFSYYGDELHFIKQAMALGTGDLNPHWFHKPAFLMYLLFFCYGGYFLVGFVLGQFGSAEQFGAHFLSDMGPFIVMGRCLVVLFGVATVYLVYRVTMRAFRSFPHGAVAAAVAAVMYPMAVGAQSVKADVPAGFFVLLSFYWLLKSAEQARFRPMAIASLLSGAAMGTKYYGIILVPGYLLVELSGRFLERRPWKLVVFRGVGVGLLFLLGFFATSPYNFLDPTWSKSKVSSVMQRLGLEDSGPAYDPDSSTTFKPGTAAAPAAARHFAERALDQRALGVGITVLCSLGLVGTALDRRTRRYAVFVALPLVGFGFFASWWMQFHIGGRHFNAILPLLCTLVFPGALFVVRLLRLPTRWRIAAALAVTLVAVAQPLFLSVDYNLKRLRPDSRTAAYRWIVSRINPNELILLDEYGPILQPSPEAVRRQRMRLEGLPEDEPFTSHQAKRLDLLESYPSPEAMNFDELSHPWWSPRELSDAELREFWKHRDTSNPMKIRVPKTLDEYRNGGYRYVITNSRAQRRYFASESAKESFPSFFRFYSQVRELEPIHTIDPAEHGGKGPVIWVYELDSRAAASEP